MAKDTPNCAPQVCVVESHQNFSKSIRLRFLCTSAAITREGRAVLKLKDSSGVKKQWLQTSYEYTSVGNPINILSVKEMKLWDSILIGR